MGGPTAAPLPAVQILGTHHHVAVPVAPVTAAPITLLVEPSTR